MFGNTLITKQTGQKGKKVNRLFIEEGCKVDREFYLSLLVDRKNAKIMMIISPEGGVNIEDVAKINPEKIHSILFSDLDNIVLSKNLEKNLCLHMKNLIKT